MIGAVGTLHFASLRLVRPGLIVFAFDVFGYSPCLRSQVPRGGRSGARDAYPRRRSKSLCPTLISFYAEVAATPSIFIPCALVNTVNSSQINTPVLGEVTDDVTPRRTY